MDPADPVTDDEGMADSKGSKGKTSDERLCRIWDLGSERRSARSFRTRVDSTILVMAGADTVSHGLDSVLVLHLRVIEFSDLPKQMGKTSPVQLRADLTCGNTIYVIRLRLS